MSPNKIEMNLKLLFVKGCAHLAKFFNQQFFIILIDYQQNSSNAVGHHFYKVVVVFRSHFRQFIFV